MLKDRCLHEKYTTCLNRFLHKYHNVNGQAQVTLCNMYAGLENDQQN